MSMLYVEVDVTLGPSEMVICFLLSCFCHCLLCACAIQASHSRIKTLLMFINIYIGNDKVNLVVGKTN